MSKKRYFVTDGWLLAVIYLAPAAMLLFIVYPLAGIVVGTIIGAMLIRRIVRRLNRDSVKPATPIEGGPPLSS